MHIAGVIIIAFFFSIIYVQLGRKIGCKMPSKIPSWDPISIIVYIITPTLMISITVVWLTDYIDIGVAGAVAGISLLAFIFGHAIADVKYHTVKCNNPKMGKPDNKLVFMVKDKLGTEHIQGQRMVDKLRTLTGRYDEAIGFKEIRSLGDEIQHGRIIFAVQKNVKYVTSWITNYDEIKAQLKKRKEENKKPMSYWRNIIILLIILMALSYAGCYAAGRADYNLYPYLMYMWVLSVVFVVIKVFKEVKFLDLDYSLTHTFTASEIMGVPDDQFYHEMKVTDKVIEGASTKIYDMRDEIIESKSQILAAIDISKMDDFTKTMEGDALEDLKKRMNGSKPNNDKLKNSGAENEEEE